MSVITSAKAYLIDIEVETVRTDAVQAFLKQETIFVDITTDDGLTGTGYSYTIGTGGKAVLAMVEELIPTLPGRDARNVGGLWHQLFASTRATTVGAITSLALAAIDTALWDLRCLRAGEPLWRLAGGARQRVPLYDTEGGWLHLSTDDLVIGAKASAAAGWPGSEGQGGQADRGRGRRPAARGARRTRTRAADHGGRQPVVQRLRSMPAGRGLPSARPCLVRGADARRRRRRPRRAGPVEDDLPHDGRSRSVVVAAPRDREPRTSRPMRRRPHPPSDPSTGG